MKVRYKKSGEEAWASRFNPCGLGEVLTGDDTVFIKDLEVWIPNVGWKDMARAFEDKDIIPDNYNLYFGIPLSQEAKEKGYN